MMNHRIKQGIPLLVIPLMVACSNQPNTIYQPRVLHASDQSSWVQHLPQSTVLQKGMVRIHNNTKLFTPCGSKQSYPLEATSQFWAHYHQLAQPSGHSLYSEFSAELEPSTNNAPYRLELKQLRLLAKTGYSSCKSPQQNYAFEAQGFGEQPWSLRMRGEIIQVITPPPNEFDFTVTSVQAQDNRHLIRFTDQLGMDGLLRFEQKLCIDPKKKWIKPYQVTLRIGSTQYQGCGSASWIKPDYSQIGIWQGSTSIQGLNSQISLQLQPDFHVLYRLQSGTEKPIRWEGFWKPLNQDALVYVGPKKQSPHAMQLDYHSGQLRLHSGNLPGISSPLDQPLFLQKKGSQITLLPLQEIQLQHSVPTHSRPLSAKTLTSSDRIDPKVEATLLRYFADHRTNPEGNSYRFIKTDLNGDGIDDLLIQMRWCQKQDSSCVMLIFKGEKQGYRFISRSVHVANQLFISPMTHHNWHDLWENNSKGWQPFIFDGIGYHEQAKLEKNAPENLPIILKFAPHWLKLAAQSS